MIRNYNFCFPPVFCTKRLEFLNCRASFRKFDINKIRTQFNCLFEQSYFPVNSLFPDTFDTCCPSGRSRLLFFAACNNYFNQTGTVASGRNQFRKRSILDQIHSQFDKIGKPATSFYGMQSFFFFAVRNGNTNHNAPSFFGYEPSIFRKVVFFFNSSKQLFTCSSFI